jgi:uncharacterized protein DUF5655
MVADIAELLRGRPPDVASLFHRLVSAIEEFDDVRIEALPKQLVLHGANRILGSIRPTQHGVNVHLNLPYRVEDRRVTRCEPLTKRLTFHRFMLSAPDDLDDQFLGWINDAHNAATAGR